MPSCWVTLKALELFRTKVIEGCGFTLGFATRRYLGEIRAIFAFPGYENVEIVDNEGVAVVKAWCTGPDKVMLMFT